MVSKSKSPVTFNYIDLQSAVPTEIASCLLPGSQVSFAEGKYGKIILQEIQLREAILLYNIYKIKKDIQLECRLRTGMILVQAALKCDSRYNIPGAGEICLAEGEFNILDVSDFQGTVFLEHDHEYRSLQILYPRGYLDELFPIIPKLKDWVSSSSLAPRMHYHPNARLSSDQKQMLYTILHLNYTEAKHRPYLELALKEFLFLCFLPIDQTITPETGLSRLRVETIHKAKFLLETIPRHQMTIAAIAQKLKINEFKLKSGFKKVFGITMSEHCAQTKMQIAKKLLQETNKPLKEIAGLAGYRTSQSFLKAFKEYFLNTPGAYRKL